MPLARTDSRTASCPSSVAPRKGCRTIPSIQPKTVVVAAIPSAKVSTATAVRAGVRRRTARRVPEVFKDASHGVPAFECNLASDCKCLIPFNGAVNQLSISGGGVRKWDASYGRSLSDRNAYPQIEISDAQQIESHLRDRSGSTARMYADTWRIPCSCGDSGEAER